MTVRTHQPSSDVQCPAGTPDAAAAVGAPPRRLTLQERAEHTDERPRDCRTCKAFVPAPGGMGYGWCRAFRTYVKLYHPAGSFYSQCQFHVLRRTVSADDGG